jgi:caa(3)-type oxidase subunit IV
MTSKSWEMSEVVRQPAVIVWVLLIALTASSFWLGVDHALGTGPLALSVVLVIAAIKAWLVERYFMGLRDAPRSLRVIVDGWLVVTAAVVIGMQILI